MQTRSAAMLRGAVAGLVAATVLVLWFLVIDLLAGRPFQTPRVLASSVFGVEQATVDSRLLVLYTALHYIVFVAIGAIVAFVIRAARLGGGFLFGLFIGLFLFDAMFYLSVVVTGVNVVERLGWPAVLFGSLLAGTSLALTLRLLGLTHGTRLAQALREHPVLRDGIISGLLAAAIVALWFLIIDIAFREAFFTPGALGSALFYGARGPAQVEISIGTVLGFTLLHMAAFIIAGLVASAFFVAAERMPPMILGFVLVATAATATIFGVVAIFASWILEVIGWWSVGLGSAFGGLAIVLYLWREHPRVVACLRDQHTVEGPGMMG